ncbi:MAG TPA: potassium-transporting ATPase subunit KdpA, partial [archaeon]|nr:potassium-transporting ATPase subunit KdpA [archaeon]
YFIALMLVNIFQMVVGFFILIFQGKLPLNPQGFPGVSWHLAFNTVISIATNTNLQHYSGETTLSYLSQIGTIQFLQFASAATGISVAIAFVRGLIDGSKDLGNFYVDFVRSLTRIIIPICLIAALIFIFLGVPQTLTGYTSVTTLEGASQLVLVGPVASSIPIMQLGTNGGGFYGANSAYPFQNPTPTTNFLEMILMMLIPTALCFVYGIMLGKKKETRPILWAAYGLFAIDLGIAFIPPQVLVSGMEVRFGGFLSNFWTVITTAMTTGSVNASLSAMHPLVILSGFMGMLIQATPGGKGVGLMYMVMFVVITVFVVGLMTGRTPEYLGVKIKGRDVLLVMLTFLVHPIIILIPTVLAYATGAAQAIGVGGGSIGFTQILWEFTSAAANNGSDFLGATANTPFFNISTAIVMFVGRYVPILILLALSGSMIGRKRSPEVGLKTDTLTFTIVLIGTIIILVALTFFPFIVLGPILSYFQGHTTGFALLFRRLK